MIDIFSDRQEGFQLENDKKKCEKATLCSHDCVFAATLGARVWVQLPSRLLN